MILNKEELSIYTTVVNLYVVDRVHGLSLKGLKQYRKENMYNVQGTALNLSVIRLGRGVRL